eukprot:TRINITY_DN1355_c0_g1_i1.p1 TRINITY_DN1355_c0_g1~~TRINITY_DN1355_c0_g1_i1.p1  ORF type:complete len:825 (+),score=209.97 TRINITY_DN1355_c0_g1_i1:388-2862(+)
MTLIFCLSLATSSWTRFMLVVWLRVTASRERVGRPLMPALAPLLLGVIVAFWVGWFCMSQAIPFWLEVLATEDPSSAAAAAGCGPTLLRCPILLPLRLAESPPEGCAEEYAADIGLEGILELPELSRLDPMPSPPTRPRREEPPSVFLRGDVTPKEDVVVEDTVCERGLCVGVRPGVVVDVAVAGLTVAASEEICPGDTPAEIVLARALDSTALTLGEVLTILAPEERCERRVLFGLSMVSSWRGMGTSGREKEGLPREGTEVLTSARANTISAGVSPGQISSLAATVSPATATSTTTPGRTPTQRPLSQTVSSTTTSSFGVTSPRRNTEGGSSRRGLVGGDGIGSSRDSSGSSKMPSSPISAAYSSAQPSGGDSAKRKGSKIGQRSNVGPQPAAAAADDGSSVANTSNQNGIAWLMQNHPTQNATITPRRRGANAGISGRPTLSRDAVTRNQTTNMKRVQDEVAKLKQKINVMKEIVVTEQDYVKDLDLVIKLFLNPIRQKKVLAQEDIQSLFCNIEDIYTTNTALLAAFGDSTTAENPNSEHCMLIANAFISNDKNLLNEYVPYVGNPQHSVHRFHQLSAENLPFAAFVKQAGRNPKLRFLDLLSFLIKPVQRVCKYPLLLKELYRSTNPTEIDYAPLSSAFNVMEAVTNDVNELKRISENMNKLKQIQSTLTGFPDLVHSGRIFVREGDMTRDKQTRHFYLFNDILLCTKIGPNNTYSSDGKIDMNKVSAQDYPDMSAEKKNVIELTLVVNPAKKKTKTLYLCCTNPDEKKAWLYDLATVATNSKNQKRVGNNLKSSVFEGGKMGNDQVIGMLKQSVAKKV